VAVLPPPWWIGWGATGGDGLGMWGRGGGGEVLLKPTRGLPRDRLNLPPDENSVSVSFLSGHVKSLLLNGSWSFDTQRTLVVVIENI
jgi:hypothetical protein